MESANVSLTHMIQQFSINSINYYVPIKFWVASIGEWAGSSRLESLCNRSKHGTIYGILNRKSAQQLPSVKRLHLPFVPSDRNSESTKDILSHFRSLSKIMAHSVRGLTA